MDAKRYPGWKYIFVILTVLWMVIIFAFSARTGVQSASDSHRVGMKAGQIFVPGFKTWTQEKQEHFAEMADLPIRKSAHAMEYALLGMLVFGALPWIGKKTGVIAWAVASFYAATDEFHQLFVPGRSGEIKDVLIDSSGVALGVLIVLVLVLLAMRNNRMKIERIKE